MMGKPYSFDFHYGFCFFFWLNTLFHFFSNIVKGCKHDKIYKQN